MERLGGHLVDKLQKANQGNVSQIQEVLEGSSEELETDIDRRGSNKLALSQKQDNPSKKLQIDVDDDDEEEKEGHGKLVARINLESESGLGNSSKGGRKGLMNLSMMSPSNDTSMASISMASISMGRESSQLDGSSDNSNDSATEIRKVDEKKRSKIAPVNSFDIKKQLTNIQEVEADNFQ